MDATQAVMGEVNPFSLTGSLPVVGDMQKMGYDIQVRKRKLQNFERENGCLANCHQNFHSRFSSNIGMIDIH